MRYVLVCFIYQNPHTAQKLVEKIVEKKVEVPIEVPVEVCYFVLPAMHLTQPRKLLRKLLRRRLRYPSNYLLKRRLKCQLRYQSRLRYVTVSSSHYTSHTAQKIVEKTVEKKVEVPVEKIKHLPATKPNTASVGSQTLQGQTHLGVQTDNDNDNTPRVKTIHVYHEQEHPTSPTSKPKADLENPDQTSEHNVEDVSTALSDKHKSVSRRGSRQVPDVPRRASSTSVQGGYIDIISRSSSTALPYGGMPPPRPTSPPPPEFIRRATNRGSQTISTGSKGRPALRKQMSNMSFQSAVGSQHNSRSGTPLSSLGSFRSAKPGNTSTQSHRRKKSDSFGTVSNIERRSYSVSSSSAHLSEPKSANNHLDEDDESDEDSVSMAGSNVLGNTQPDPIIQAITQTMIGE